MAQPGIGYKQVYQTLFEIANHLVSQTSLTSLSTAITPGLQFVTLGSTSNLIIGNQAVVDPGLSTEEAIVISDITPTQIQAQFSQSHAAGATFLASCFPEQALTDPFYTQSEVMSYISRAQNEFLSRVPCYFLLTYSTILYGQQYQSLPCTPIELIRVALSPTNVPILSLVRSNGIVTVTTQSPHNLSQGSKFSIINAPLGIEGTSFNGAFRAIRILSPTSFTFAQQGVDDITSLSGGTVSLWTRLKEVTQEMLTLTNPGWQNDYQAVPQNWYEDRTGLYKYGVDCKPSGNFPTELLMSIRDTDSLGLIDGYLVPDIMVHLLKYRALQYAFEKDGENRNPQLAQYCGMRFERGVIASLRWLDAMMGQEMMGTSPVRQRQSQARRA